MKNVLSQHEALTAVIYWRRRLKSCGYLDKDGKAICSKNLQIAKDHLSYIQELQPTQLKLNLNDKRR